MTRIVGWGLMCTMALFGSLAEAAACTLTTNGVHFGTVAARAMRTEDVLASVIIQCWGIPGETLHYRVRPLGVGAALHARTLAGSGTGTLGYNLYLDAARTQIWGDGNDNTREISATVQLSGPVYGRVIPIYARLGPTGAAKAGAYLDTVVIAFDY